MLKYILKLILPKFLIDFIKDFNWRRKNLGSQITPCGTNINLNSFMDYLVFKEIFVDKVYDDYIKHSLLRNVFKNNSSKIIDLGGNLGFFTIRCCEIWMQEDKKNNLEFIIYEPSISCLLKLKKNLKQFDQNIFTFDVRENLVGKKTGWDWFIEDEDNHLGQCVSDKIKTVGKRHTRKVSYCDLTKDICDSDIDILKCDIEGSEVEFLKTYSNDLNNVFSIIIETHGKESKKFVCNELKKIGFTLNDRLKFSSESFFSNLFFTKTFKK